VGDVGGFDFIERRECTYGIVGGVGNIDAQRIQRSVGNIGARSEPGNPSGTGGRGDVGILWREVGASDSGEDLESVTKTQVVPQGLGDFFALSQCRGAGLSLIAPPGLGSGWRSLVPKASDG
jgi:hypothetical protein